MLHVARELCVARDQPWRVPARKAVGGAHRPHSAQVFVSPSSPFNEMREAIGVLDGDFINEAPLRCAALHAALLPGVRYGPHVCTLCGASYRAATRHRYVVRLRSPPRALRRHAQ
jgi:hypothetical protein